MPHRTSNREQLHPAIQEMVRRVVAAFDPERIILFGSYARGAAGPNSDADLMVVMNYEGKRHAKLVEIYRAIGAVGLAKDIVLVRPSELEEHRDDPGYVIYHALREGKVLYERARQPA